LIIMLGELALLILIAVLKAIGVLGKRSLGSSLSASTDGSASWHHSRQVPGFGSRSAIAMQAISDHSAALGARIRSRKRCGS